MYTRMDIRSKKNEGLCKIGEHQCNIYQKECVKMKLTPREYPWNLY